MKKGVNMNNIIEIKGLCKSFADVKAVNNIDFCVRKGELFAFLGVNGAGKSTTISIISGLLKKDKGTVIINGFDIDRDKSAAKGDIGIVFQDSVLDMPLTVKENLESRAALYGIHGENFRKRLDELSNLLDFKDILKRKVGKLSGGQRRRIDIARALLHEPSLLILDEPTTGLDPQTRKNIWQVIETLRREKGLTVFLTTHYMEEAADADYVVILDSGNIVAKGTPLELKNRYSGDFITIYGAKEEEISALGVAYEKNGEVFKLSVPDTASATSLIISHPEIFNDYEIIKGRMDDVFLSVTGKKLVGGGEQ